MSHSSDETPLLARGLNSPERATPSRLRPKVLNRMSSSTPVPERPHVEKHMGQYDSIMRDVIIGFSDGLTVPFALTAGLSSLGNTKIVIMGGLAELCSGMISMGLGAYLAADTERQHWYVIPLSVRLGRAMKVHTNNPSQGSRVRARVLRGRHRAGHGARRDLRHPG